MEQTDIVVVGVGTAAGKVLMNLSRHVDFPHAFIYADTDKTAVESSPIKQAVLLKNDQYADGKSVGYDPARGRAIAMDCLSEVMLCIEPYSTVIFIAGLGHGTGSTVTPVFATEAMARGKKIFCIVTTPFLFEGGHWKKMATQAIQEMTDRKLPMVVGDNQELFAHIKRTSFDDAFSAAGNSICNMLLKVLSEMATVYAH